MSWLTKRTSYSAVTLAAALALGVGLAFVAVTNASSSSSSPSANSVPSSPSPGSAPRPNLAPGSSSSASTAQVLRRIELKRLRLLVAGDADRAASLHANDFELIPPPGSPMNRDDYLGAVATGDLDYHVFEPISEIEVRVHGVTAVLWYESRIDIAAAGLGRFEHDTWHLYYYEKRAGKWRVVREQATAVGGFPPLAG